jgi:hypothetical protein
MAPPTLDLSFVDGLPVSIVETTDGLDEVVSRFDQDVE